MMHELLDILELLDKIAAKKYLPTRVWKLFKAVKGDFGKNADGTPRECLRMRERERKKKKDSNEQ